MQMQGGANSSAFFFAAISTILWINTRRDSPMDALDGLVLTYYREPGKRAFQSITRLQEAEAFQKAAELFADCHSLRPRFGPDFAQYYPARMATERWLYDAFCALGYSPVEQHPLYFVLGKSDMLRRWMGEGEVIELPLHALDRQQISFTLGDSMAMRCGGNTNLLLDAPSLLEEMTRRGQNAADFLESFAHQNTYVETQVWDDAGIMRYMQANAIPL